MSEIFTQSDFAEFFKSWGRKLNFLRIETRNLANQHDVSQVTNMREGGVFIVQDLLSSNTHLEGRDLKNEKKIFFTKEKININDIVFLKKTPFRIIERYEASPDFSDYISLIGVKTDQRNLNEFISKS